MTSRTSREPLIAAAVLAAGFVALTLWVRFHGTIPGDAALLERATRRAIAPSMDASNFYQFFGGLGSPWVAALTVAVAALVTLRNVGGEAAGLIVAAAVIAVAHTPLARLIGPTDAAAQLTFVADGYPSGHVLYATSMFGMLAWLGHRHGRAEVTAVCILVMVLMGIARVSDRSHLLDEVLAGYLLGGAWLCLLIAFARRA